MFQRLMNQNEAGAQRVGWRRLGHACAFLLLWALFDLPLAVRPDGIDVWAVRPTAEAMLLISATVFALASPRWRIWRVPLLLVALLLVVLRLDHVIFYFLMRAPPLLYDQLLMVRHLFVLLGDLWSWQLALGLAGGVVVLALAGWGVKALCGVLADAAQPPFRGASVAAIGVLWAVFGVVSLSPWANSVQWVTPSLVRNVADSVATHRATSRRFESSPYAPYRKVKLRQRPDVYLFLVESYGRVLRHRSMRRKWRNLMHDMGGRLEAQGYSAVSGYSRSPVSGGRSWVAEGNILTGLSYEYQPEHRHVMENLGQIPHLVGFLDGQGYQTVLLAPADRPRPGVEHVNHYYYDHLVGFNQLQWKGPRMGWGIIPDEYSLTRAHETLLSKVEEPLFLNFHMVSSHAPWKHIPPLRAHWKTMKAPKKKKQQKKKKRKKYTPSSEVVRRMRSYERRDAPDRRGALKKRIGARYVAGIQYTLGTLRNYIVDHAPDGLIIIMGDHQPPLVSPEGASFEVPVHFISKDPSLLVDAQQAGFKPGLIPLPPPPRAQMEHAGLLSLIVRSLARPGADPEELPPLRRAGVPLVDRRRERDDAKLVSSRRQGAPAAATFVGGAVIRRPAAVGPR